MKLGEVRLGSYPDLKATKVHVHLYWAFFDSGSALVFGWPIAMGRTDYPGSSLPGHGPGFFRFPDMRSEAHRCSTSDEDEETS